mmetsp:Transcript_12140/g.34749  ORF Transcript_12140/g.34749 Transcript_12140/m.34749 type:complete len:327 (-) Transcript_12140:2899-3879(-)
MLFINRLEHANVLDVLAGPLDEIGELAAVHGPINTTENDHNPHGALDPVVEPFELCASLLALLLVHGLFEWLDEGFDRRGNGDGMAGAHGNDNLVGLELNILDIPEGGGKDGHEGRDIQTGGALLKAGSKNAECSLSERKGIIDRMLEGTHVDNALHLQPGKLIQGGQDVLLHQPGDELRRVMDGGIDHQQSGVLDHDIFFLQESEERWHEWSELVRVDLASDGEFDGGCDSPARTSVVLGGRLVVLAGILGDRLAAVLLGKILELGQNNSWLKAGERSETFGCHGAHTFFLVGAMSEEVRQNDRHAGPNITASAELVAMDELAQC